MPLVKSFDGRVVTKMKKIGDNTIKLWFANQKPGQRKPTAVVTQEQWDQLGHEEFVEPEESSTH